MGKSSQGMEVDMGKRSRKKIAPRRAAKHVEEYEAYLEVREADLAELGVGVVAYIKIVTRDDAEALLPDTRLPTYGTLYGLFAADGEAIVLTTDSRECLLKAMDEELTITPLN